MPLAKWRSAAAAAALCSASAAYAGPAGETPPELLFWSGFEGPLKLLAPTDCYRNGCFQQLVGTDSLTGFRWPLQLFGGENRFQLLVNGPRPTPDSVGEYMFNELRTVTGRNGKPTRALYSEVRQSGCCGTQPQGRGATQNALHVVPGADPAQLYISKWLKLQPDLGENLRKGAPWRVVFEWKEGTPATRGGAFRAILQVVYRGGGAPRWQVTWDNDANAGLPRERYWRRENGSVPVPAGEWFKLEVFWSRSKASDGRIWFAVNGKVIDDHRGRTVGVRDDPVGRIFLNQVYAGSAYPIYQWTDDVQIWKSFPTARAGDPWYDPPYAPH